MTKIEQKWKKDKKITFLKGSTIISIIASMLCFIVYNLKGNYVDEQGYLVESFGFIPLAYLFALIAFISAISLAVIVIFRYCKKR